MSTSTKSVSRTNHARKVTRRVKSDLTELREYFDCISEKDINDWAHDIELGLDRGAISSFEFQLSKNGSVNRSYKYIVNANGEVEENLRGGRIEYNALLRGSTLDIYISPIRSIWDPLKENGELKISWTSGDSPTSSHLSAKNDGSYSSGSLGLKRSALS